MQRSPLGRRLVQLEVAVDRSARGHVRDPTASASHLDGASIGWEQRARIPERKDLAMVARTVEAPVMLMKKMGGMVSLIIGCLLTALGIEFQSTSSTVVGILFLVLGGTLLALKIIRRNQGNAQGG
jgi:hypothetical protein